MPRAAGIFAARSGLACRSLSARALPLLIFFRLGRVEPLTELDVEEASSVVVSDRVADMIRDRVP